MLLAPMLTLSDVSKGGWDTCAQGANTSCLQLPTYVIEVASVIDRKGLARAGSWFMTEG